MDDVAGVIAGSPATSKAIAARIRYRKQPVVAGEAWGRLSVDPTPDWRCANELLLHRIDEHRAHESVVDGVAHDVRPRSGRLHYSQDP
jgi:hypothetical protein